jgi:hypothetical protein
LTSTISKELAVLHNGCNVVAGFYPDSVFITTQDTEKAMRVLAELGKNKK